MKCVRVTGHGGRERLEIEEREKPEPGQGELRIEVRAAGINFADIMQRRGDYHGGPTPPYTPGMEVAGVVDAVGEGVGREPGEEVVAMVDGGGYAEYALADATGVFDVPEGFSFEEAAGFPVQFLTAHNCLHGWGRLEEAEAVLIHAAAGGVGTAAVQLAREAGAEIFGTASTAEKLSKAESLGCDHPINYVEEDFVEVVDRETDHGVDLVLDSVGGETTSRSLEALRHFGRMVVFGAASGEPGRLRTDNVLFANQEILGYHLGHALRQQPMRVMEAVPDLVQHLETGTLEVQLDRTFTLDAVRDAHAYIENRESMGKVVLKPTDAHL